ncbi:carboxymuconolactone decarboxylase family protein [Pimelobacter simplex]|uniref:carboxymuconolactone decarboxylase family protein n=1 Tax=Nocardioides simplex TaxID=2045 RepID=UPI001931EA58|nr:carboxymuconolactone decarboxylase family protein [Pimelobacter simplex]
MAEQTAAVAEHPEAQQYVDDMVRARGYVLDYHKVMAKHDFEVLQATNGLVHAAYLKERLLDRKVKELIFVNSLTVLKAPKGQIESHIRVALDLGVSPQEILEAIEIALPEAGVVAFQIGFDAWKSVTGATGLDPTVEVHDAGEVS